MDNNELIARVHHEEEVASQLAELSNAQIAWDRMNDNEKFGVKFGLLPSWVEEFDWTHDDTVELMKLA